jgi:NADH:ubiquinone oxidoreductase subunit 6 (subunit J)
MGGFLTLGLIGVIIVVLGVFFSSTPLYSLLYFLLFTLFTGFIYITLGFELIGIIQIVLYGGAIAVFLLFMISFLKLPKYQIPFSNFIKFILLMLVWGYGGWHIFKKLPPITIKYIPINKEIISDLFETYPLVFELLSLLVLLIPILFYFAKEEKWQ